MQRWLKLLEITKSKILIFQGFQKDLQMADSSWQIAENALFENTSNHKLYAIGYPLKLIPDIFSEIHSFKRNFTEFIF